MKKIITVGLGILSILIFSNANAVEIKPFIGANISLNNVVWSSEIYGFRNDGLYMPEYFFGLGAEAGAVLKTDGIYNPGLTLAYDYIFNSSADIKYPASEVFSSVETGFSSISGTFDNYIRYSGDDPHRADLVLGIGLANITERVEIRYTSYGKNLGLNDNKGTDDGTFVVLKLGTNFQVSDKIGFYVNGRIFVPTAKNSDVGTLGNLSWGLRFVF